MKFNKSLLEKVEGIFKSFGYKIRYEKGNFQSGSCVVWNRKMIVIPKFYPLEEKTKVLLDILRDDKFDISLLDNDDSSFVQKIRQMTIFS